MTPKEKAVELVDKMGFSTSHTIDNTSGERTPIYRNQFAKQCALIALRDTVWGYLNQQPEEIQKYWQEVKQEIEKL